MDNAAYTTNDLFVGGVRLELQARFVQRLQQFVGALEEQGAQFPAAIIVRTAHVEASER